VIGTHWCKMAIRRAGVTGALQTFEGKGLIETAQG
jgi:hypothetical protein